MMRFVVALAALQHACAIMEEGVLVLKATNFENYLAENHKRGMMVYFYAPWCQHCQELAPEFAAAAQELDGVVRLAKCDATQNEAIAQQYEVTAYPAIKFFKGGRVLDAGSAGRDAASIVSAATRLSQDRVKPLEDSAAIDAVFAAAGVRVVGFFKTGKTKAARAFFNACDEFRYPVEFHIATGDEMKETVFSRAVELMKKEGASDGDDYVRRLSTVPKAAIVLLFKPYDERVEIFHVKEGKEGTKQLAKWLESQMMPLVVPFIPNYVEMIFSGPLQMHAILAVDPAVDFTVERDVFYEAAKRNRGKVLHIVMFKAAEDADEDDEETTKSKEEMRSVWEFLKIAKTPSLVMSDMTVQTEEKPAGEQELFTGSITDIEAVMKFESRYASKAIARKAGLDPKMAEIMSDPKMQEMIKDPKMSSMFQIMGMPQQLVDIYREAL